MKEFITAVEDIEAEDEREAKIKALVEGVKTEDGKGWVTPPISREDAESEVDGEPFTEFKLDDRVMRAYKPTGGQLIFMLAALGRGQSKEQRFAAIINIMLSSLRDDDADHLEGRLLARSRKDRLDPEKIEGIFEYLTAEWFREDVSGSGESLPDRR